MWLGLVAALHTRDIVYLPQWPTPSPSAHLFFLQNLEIPPASYDTTQTPSTHYAIDLISLSRATNQGSTTMLFLICGKQTVYLSASTLW